MSEAIETLNYRGYEISVEYDDNGINPRDDYNFSNMFLFTRNYTLGDENEYEASDFNNFNEMEKQIKKDFNVRYISPVYMYSHSGITISTTPFNDRFDSGKIGFVFVTKEMAMKEFGKKPRTKKIASLVEAEIDTYDKYLRGEVYYYVIKDENNEVIHDCGGYYDTNYALQDAKHYVDCHIDYIKRKSEEKMKQMIKERIPVYLINQMQCQEKGVTY